MVRAKVEISESERKLLTKMRNWKSKIEIEAEREFREIEKI
jgi:hypothetical protein